MDLVERAVPSLERRVGAVLFIRQLLGFAAVWCVAWGVAALILRYTISVPPAILAWGAGGLLPVALLAWRRARRQMPTGDQLLALLDARGDCGGLLMASADTSLGAWTVSAAEDAVPQVRWRARRAASLALAAAAFVAAVLIAPSPARATRAALDVHRDVDRLESRIDLLRQEEVLQPERAEQMTKTLEQLRKDAAGDDPAKAWETLDAVDEASARAAKEAADAAVRQAEELTKVEAMATGLDAGVLDASQAAAAMADLASEVKRAAESSKQLAKDMPADVREAAAKSALSAAQLRQLAAAARHSKSALRGKLGKLRDKSLIDPKALRDFERAAAMGDRGDLARFLKENPGQDSYGNTVGQWCKNGKPGISRGRGDAPMFFGDKTEDGGKFAEKTLPPSAAAALADSEIVGISAGAPQTDTAGHVRTGGLAGAQNGGGSAFTPSVLPRHRGTVQRYFERRP